jgi:phage tail sheath protein FI
VSASTVGRMSGGLLVTKPFFPSCGTSLLNFQPLVRINLLTHFYSMPPTLNYPGVYIEEPVSGVHTIAGVATSIAAFIGYTEQGVDNRAEHIFSFSDFQRLFGGLAADSELSYAVQQFFQNGGTEAYVVRTPRAGASAATASFETGSITWQFKALSSGSWADSNLILDLDYQGLSQPVAGTVSVDTGSPTIVTGVGTLFNTALLPGQWLVFASDTTSAPYQIKSIESATSLTLQTAVANPTSAAGTAQVYFDGDPTAFNLTVTNLLDGTMESFPEVSLNSKKSNYLPGVLNDPDTGSQLVNVLPNPAAGPASTVAPKVTGTVGSTLSAGAVVAKLCGGPTPETLSGLAVTNASPTVQGTGLSGLTAGTFLVIDFGTSCATYQISSVDTNTQITLASNYFGATNSSINATVVSQLTATDDFTCILSVSAPATLPVPLPLTVTVFPKGSAPPLTLTGLAAKLQTALNSSLMAKMPGASLTCSVAQWSQALRVVGALPGFPDAVFTFNATATLATNAAAILKLDFNSTKFTSNVGHYALGTGHVFGAQTESLAGGDGTGLPDTAKLIGDQSLFTGIYALEKVDLFNLLCIPDATRASAGDPNTPDPKVDTNAIYSAAISYCTSRRAFLLIDAPPNINTVAAAVDWKTTLLTVQDSAGHAAAYFPRLRLPDPLNGYQLRTFAPSGVVAGLFARIDATRGVWKAPAGTEATLTGVQSLVYKLSDSENGALNPLGLNCARTFPVYGTVMWGARTIVGADAQASQWKYIPVRRLALFLEESLYRGSQWVVFEPNDEPLWAQIRLNIGAFMQDLFRQGAFQGSTPKDAYFVKCDKDTTTQNDINLGKVNIVVGFAPLKPAEFVVIQIQQMAGQIQT